MAEKAFKNFSYLAMGNVTSTAMTAAFFLIFASLLEPTDYGEMGYLIALAGTFSTVSRFGLGQSLMVYLAKGETQLSNQINLLVIITTSAASIILIFINEFAAFLCIASSFFMLYQSNILGEKRYKWYFKNTVLRNILIFLISFSLYFVIGIPGIILGMAFSNIISSMWLVKHVNLKDKSLRLIKNNYKVLINNFGIDASFSLKATADQLLVATVFGFAFAGLYIFNMQILYALGILPGILYIFLLPEEASGKKHPKINYLVIFATILIVLAVIIFSPLIIEQLFPNYSDGILGLQILAISIIPTSISLIMTAKMQARKSTRIGYSVIVSVGSLLILLVLLGNEYGMIGVSIAVLTSAILNTIFLFLLYRDVKILRFFLPHKVVKYWYRLIIKKDPEIIIHSKWMKDGAERFNFQYDLNSDSNVLDLGGYKGDWAYEISKRYNSNIFIFEPVQTFYNNIKKRFKTVEKIHVYNYGVSSSTTNTEIALEKDSSSVFNIKPDSLTEVIRLVDIVQVINEHHFEKIDLIKINIEGGEFEVLSRLIDSKKIKLCKNLLVQFHPIISDAQTRYENIRKQLAQTHHLTFDYPWVWENWKLND